MTEQAVAKRQEAPPAVVGDTAAIFSLVERMATDPNISIDRVEQTFAFYQKVKADRARDAFLSAFAGLQSSLPAVARKGTGNNGKYARFEDFIEAIRPLLTEYGFSLRHDITTRATEQRVTITAILGHRDGHEERTSIDLPFDDSGRKTPVHALASSISYGKRYTGFAITGVASENEDDDGKAAGAGDTGETINEQQEAALKKRIEAVGSDIIEFCTYFKLDKISDLKVADIDRANKALDGYQRGRK
jgi:hypothetical protein